MKPNSMCPRLIRPVSVSAIFRKIHVRVRGLKNFHVRVRVRGFKNLHVRVRDFKISHVRVRDFPRIVFMGHPRR